MKVLVLLAIILIATPAFAQTVFHPVEELKAGIFGSAVGGGNYTFSNSMFVVDKLGIGTASPGNKLSVITTTSLDGMVVGNGSNSVVIYPGTVGTGSANPLVQAGDNAIIFTAGTLGTGNFVIAPWAGSASGIRITNTGNVGIGTTSPTEKLNVIGSLRVDNSTGSAILYVNSTSNNVGIGTTTPNSDYRLDVNGGATMTAAVVTGQILIRGAPVTAAGELRFEDTALPNKKITATYTNQQLRWVSEVNKYFVFNGSTGNFGIGTLAPSQTLDVNGIAQMTGFKLPTGASNGYVLTSDASGVGTWQVAAGTIGGSGTTNYIPKFTAGTTLGNSVIYDNGANVGIGTTVVSQKLTVAGNVNVTGTYVYVNGVCFEPTTFYYCATSGWRSTWTSLPSGCSELGRIKLLAEC